MQNNILEVQHLSMVFGGIVALRNINFTVKENSITALIGPNGAGKTTLFNCLTGFYQSTSGQLLFHGKKPMEISKVLGQPFRVNHLVNPRAAFETLYFKMLGG